MKERTKIVEIKKLSVEIEFAELPLCLQFAIEEGQGEAMFGRLQNSRSCQQS